MIVSCYFPGDQVDLAWRQHDVYHEALLVIVDAVYGHLNQAAEMLDLRNPHQRANGRDHRTFQMAHDILAAAWRHQTEHRDFLKSKPGQSMHDWLTWLRAECGSWNRSPEIVRLFITIFENQNNNVGYAAEDDLAHVLIRRFRDVPWESQLP